MRFEGTDSYVATDDLKLAVNAAVTLERPLLARALRFVPAAMLTALIVPMVVAPGGAIEPASPRVLAALVAAAVAFRTRSTLATLAAGMLALWIIQAIGG